MPHVRRRTCVLSPRLPHGGAGFAFGQSSQGGCEACSINLQRLWCELLCAPNQAQFVRPLGVENVTDPTTSGNATVLRLAMEVSPETVCGVSESCQRTAKARNLPALGTCNGLLEYEWQHEAVQFGSLTQFNYTDAATAARFTPDNCVKFVNTTGQVDSCPCSACQASCNASGTGGQLEDGDACTCTASA